MLKNLVAVVLLLCLVSPATAQDEDIADTEKWYLLEETLFAYEAVAARQVGDAAQCLVADAERWRAQLEACGDDGCREAAYLERLASLDALQDETTRATGLEFPTVPQLVTVLAPEDDEAQTPKDFAAAPDFEARGLMVTEMDDIHHMGLAVRTEAQATHVLVFLMELGNSPNHAALQVYAADHPDGQVLARGVADHGAEDGIANFNTSTCRFVYAVPAT